MPFCFYSIAYREFFMFFFSLFNRQIRPYFSQLPIMPENLAPLVETSFNHQGSTFHGLLKYVVPIENITFINNRSFFNCFNRGGTRLCCQRGYPVKLTKWLLPFKLSRTLRLTLKSKRGGFLPPKYGATFTLIHTRRYGPLRGPTSSFCCGLWSRLGRAKKEHIMLFLPF